MNSKILILYHYYHPDDVVSATHFTGLCEGLAQRGHQVEVWPANRACHPETMKLRWTSHFDKSYSLKVEEINGVKVRRVWRPDFRQHSFVGRILNSIWMLKAWWLRLLFTPNLKPDIIIIGTDPLFAVMLTPFLKLIRPKAKFVHWCFDLYPEAAISDGLLSKSSKVIKVIRYFLKKSYKACDLVADIGPCMREKMEWYGIKKKVTLTPWALEEPSQPLPFDTKERLELFGDSTLGLLYSGSFGRAH